MFSRLTDAQAPRLGPVAQVSEADEDFILEQTERLMRHHFEAAFGEWNLDFRRSDLREALQSVEHQIISCDAKPIGCLAVRRSTQLLFIQKLYLLPEYQNRRIGTGIMKNLISQAAVAGRVLRLSILPSNKGAKMFYQRLGSVISGTDDPFVTMNYRGAF